MSMRDVTAENVISRLPDRNPAPVENEPNGEFDILKPCSPSHCSKPKLRLNQPLPSEMVKHL